MGAQTVSEGARYRAFISYSHKDSGFGRWLHRRLEAYLIPHRLVGRASDLGAVPRRLAPIFRDREELPAANDLSTEVRAALQQSASLIVVCSREAAASQWVSREVDLFRALHPDRPILAAIRSGEPPDCFPQSLLRRDAGGEAIEPLAADFRRERDGEQLGLLKLVAGMIGIGLDELIQRDTQRRLQRVTAITALALVAMLVMSGLTVFALNARTEAERQRGEAEGLVEYMLTDLRDRLKGVGRLDVMSAVNERALRYYADQDLNGLPAVSLGRRARIFHAMGEDDATRNNYKSALAEFQEAHRTTATLLAQTPNDPERIFDHAQSEYWIGYINYAQSHFAEAKLHFIAYKKLADAMVKIGPNDPRYLRELGYAEGNLCTIALRPPKDRAAALRLCASALARIQGAAEKQGAPRDIQSDIANREGWLADAYLANKAPDFALQHRLKQDKILHALMEADPKNNDLRDDWIALQRVLARALASAGKSDEAKARLTGATKTLDAMIRFDPSNQEWAKKRSKLDSDMAAISSVSQPRRKP